MQLTKDKVATWIVAGMFTAIGSGIAMYGWKKLTQENKEDLI